MHSLTLAAALLVLPSALGDSVTRVWVSISDDRCVYSPSQTDDALANATFMNAGNITGWGQLWVQHTSADACSCGAECLQKCMQAAGCAEGMLTAEQTLAYWTNYAAAEYGPAGPSDALRAFMSRQAEYAASLAESTSYPFAEQLNAVLSQAHGFAEGVSASGVAPGLDGITLYLLQSVGDLEDLNGLFPNTLAVQREIPVRLQETDCSGAIVITDTDVLAAHATWRSYYAMLRIYKTYNFTMGGAQVYTSFSSSPGLIHSKDDWYTVTATGFGGLVVMETTNSVFNTSLYARVCTHADGSFGCLLSWQRAWIANAVARSGKEWTSAFALENSGTYNNQWMVLDVLRAYDAARGGSTQDVLWIVEQLPGETQAGDVSGVLMAQGYWASYNIPFFPAIYNVSGYPAEFAKYGDQYSYSNCSRARIFARNLTSADKPTDVAGLRSLIRYNNWQQDPLAGGNPILGGVSARGDLRPTTPAPFGGVDAKVVSLSAMLADPTNYPVWCENGPTHDQQPVFTWSNFPQFVNVSRVMLVDTWTFPTVPLQGRPVGV